MYLKLKSKITKDKNIFLNCPYNFENKDSNFIFNCINCKNAPCILACKKNAIFYVSDGVVSIDQSKCDGCGDCVLACPHNAIVLNKKKAYKCDLCSLSNFSMFCYKNNKDVLELIDNYSDDEINVILNRYLG